MTYFLDFDRTLLDFDGYLGHLLTVPAFSQFHADIRAYRDRVLPRPEVLALSVAIDEWYAHGGYQFSPGELVPHIYPDVLPFLSVHGNETYIVTSGGVEISYHQGRIECTGLHTLVRDVLYVRGRDEGKGPVIQQHTENADFVFVDDKESQLDSVAELFPSAKCYHIARAEHSHRSDRYPVIASLTELP